VLILSLTLDVAFVLSLVCFLMMHFKLLSMNCSTIEMYEKQRISPWPYDRGTWNNIRDVFGHSLLLAFLPLHTEYERQRIMDDILNQRFVGSRTPIDELV